MRDRYGGSLHTKNKNYSLKIINQIYSHIRTQINHFELCNEIYAENNEAKQRKVIAEYVELCGYGHGEIGRNHVQKDQNGLSEKLSLDEIAQQLVTSKTNLKRALSIERNLTPEMKNLLDTSVITKTLAALNMIKCLYIVEA